MLSLLKEALEELPDLIGADGPEWNSLDINYHHPFVQRVWLPWREDYRINVHRIMPCSPEDALWHPHSWPSAMLVLDGEYEMGIGDEHTFGEESLWRRSPKIVAKVVLTTGSFYEMVKQSGWHYVAPRVPTYTVMLTGLPFEERLTEEDRKFLKLPKPEFRLTSLDDETVADIQTATYLLLQQWRLKNK